MKKYFLTSSAVLVLGGLMASCTHDDFDYSSLVESKKAAYQEVFVDAYGKIDPNQTWGFSSAATTKGVTRSITVNGDVYDKFPSKDDVADKFPTSIPADAVEITPKTDYNFWSSGKKNFKITSDGTYEGIGSSFYNTNNIYNIYIETEGTVTLKHGSPYGYNLYVLKGNVILDDVSNERTGIISVADGATLTDPRAKIQHNSGVQVYNRGTFNATNEKYDIGNFCTVYNEGTFKVTGALTYSPGDANTSYFVNFGDDAKLTAASMTLNSSGNFYNDGTATITGETNVTQKGIYWVNAGHYTTGSMVFSAKNATFYNYCQLLVKGNAHMYDGEFNLMNGSYTEAATAEFDNFIVNMESNSGFNVNGNTDWAGQGDGTYQGFRTSGSNVYVRLGGTTTIAAHKLSLELTGNITYAIKEIVDLGASNSGVQPTYRFNAGTVEIPFAMLNVTPKTNDCGAAWTTDGTIPSGGDDITIPTDKSETTEGQIKVITTTEYYETTELIEQGRVFCEDLGQISTNDFDFNDVVFDAYIYKITPQTRTIVEDEELGTTTGDYVDAGEPTYKTTIILLAAGGTLQLSVAGQEVHNALGASSTSTIVNTITSYEESYHNDYITADPVELGTDFTYSTIADIPIWVYYNENNILKLEAEPGMAPHKILVPIGTKWCKERKDIDKDVYLDFKAYVNSSQDFWEGRITEANLFVHPKDNYKERSKTPERKLDESKTTTKTTYRNGGSSTSGGYQGETVLSRQLR